MNFASKYCRPLSAVVFCLAGCAADASSGSSALETDHAEGNGKGDSSLPSVRPDAGTKKDAGATTANSASSASTKRDGGTAAGTSSANADKGNLNVPCDVAAVLRSNCATCHGAEPAFGAPASLVTLADFQKKSTKGTALLDAVGARINESDPTKAMPPSTGTKLTSAQLRTLNAWLDGGAKGSSDTCDVQATSGSTDGVSRASADNPDAFDTSDLDCYKLTANTGDLKTPFKVGTAIDKYYNFTFKAPWKGTGYGVVFKPIIDNKKVIHHWLLFQDATNKAPTGGVNSSGAHPDGQLLYGWAPGGQALDFRPIADVGFEMPDNVSYTLEYHYNSNDAEAVDASGIELCLAKKKPANIAGISWLGYDQLAIPSTQWTGQCVPENTVPVRIMGVQPHMHIAGRHMKAVIHRVGGKDEVLHDAPFDFNDERHYFTDVTIMPGDTITTDCTFDKPMAWGESTGEEMCYLFTFAYPKNALKDSGPWGSTAHGGSACLGQ